MRPRVFPAEDLLVRSPRTARRTRDRFNEAAGIPRGRPTPRAYQTQDEHAGFNEAAGIPRGRRRSRHPGGRGETGPRRFNEAAGIPRGRRTQTQRTLRIWRTGWSFNEAAGIPRGRPRHTSSSLSLLNTGQASMRPRVFPAEDMRKGGVGYWTKRRCRFNEAAGIPRGRPGDVGPLGSSLHLRLASMRPRVFPAEDHGSPAPGIHRRRIYELQ